MTIPRLILFEGMFGSGKSWTSQLLEQELRTSGYSVRWFHELSKDHPFAIPSDANGTSALSFLERSIAQWSGIANKRKNATDIWVVDSGYLQKLVMTALQRGISHTDILDVFISNSSCFKSLNLTFIYLKPEDLASHLKQVFNHRGEVFKKAIVNWASATKGGADTNAEETNLRFWRDYLDICDQVLDVLRSASVDVRKYALSNRLQCLEDLGLEFDFQAIPPELEIDPQILGCFSDEGEKHHCKIERSSGCYIISGLIQILEENTQLERTGDQEYRLVGQDIILQFSDDLTEILVKSSWIRINGIRLLRR